MKLGVWIIGAKGGVATTLITGVLSIYNHISTTTGIVTEKPEFKGLNLVPLANFVFGGYDIRHETLFENAESINEATGTLNGHRLPLLKDQLNRIEQDIKPGISLNCGDSINALVDEDLPKNGLSLREIIADIQHDIREFKDKHQIGEVVVLNLASTEPFDDKFINYDAATSLAGLEKALDADQKEYFPASTIYAYAAISAGYPYINFTPSIGSETAAMKKLAIQKSVPHMGKDGKTGETMVKSMLASMFPIRNLQVLSWAGFNILGDRDGAILANPANKTTKIRSKDAVLRSVLGPDVQTHTAIDYIQSLDDWKTAWDHIHFKGFLDTRMVMQFIWQGCDAILAAPLAIDMVRLAEFAKRKGEKGLMPHLAVFFKSPLEITEHSLTRQYVMLEDYVAKHTNK